MKKILVMAFAVMLLVLVASSAQAAFLPGDNFSQGLQDPVSFWAVDDMDENNPHDYKAVLNIDAIDVGCGYNLQYRYADLGWVDAVTTSGYTVTSIDIFTNKSENDSANHSLYGDALYKEMVWFRLYKSDTDTKTSASLLFKTYEEDEYGLNLFDGLDIDWNCGTIRLDIVASGDSDNLAPVPIPPSAAMLFFGLLGLFGVRRMRRDS